MDDLLTQYAGKIPPLYCTVQDLKYMCLWQVSLAGDSGSLIGHLSLTSGGAPNFDVADSLDSAYLGPFTLQLKARMDLVYVFTPVKVEKLHRVC